MENIEQDLSSLLNEFENKVKSLENRFNVKIAMSDVSFTVEDNNREALNPGGKLKSNHNAEISEIITFAGLYRCPRNSDGQRVCKKGG